ncbi:MAG: acylphosphatase [Smithellaceae bacterium]|jgi:acylphosphatase|nr:acylphosphatase [Smithellaceae bacterium]HBL54152.1 acylphosphatase [Syntrophaceae bacterium]HCX01520.1 acylphosphatase [Syntrophaceae bacterium]
MKRVHVYISGRVQGVCFRAMTQQTALNLKLTGWVRNMDDGRVEALLEGEDAAVDQMVVWCKTGPPAARVDDIEIIEKPYMGNMRSFHISYS